MKKLCAYLLLIALLLTACGRNAAPEPTAEGAVSAVSAEECFLCGNENFPYWGQNNVGIVSLNTFDVMPIEINHYDDSGAPVTENLEFSTVRNFSGTGSGFRAFLLEDVIQGCASGHISLYEDETLNVENTASFLCADCLDGLLSNIRQKGVGIGIIHFADKEIRAFEQTDSRISLGDYDIQWTWDTPTDTLQMELSVTYSPQ